MPTKYRYEFDVVCHDRERLIKAAIQQELDNRRGPPTGRGRICLDDGDTPVPAEKLHDWFNKNFDEAIFMLAQEHVDGFFEQWDCCEKVMHNVREVSNVEGL